VRQVVLWGEVLAYLARRGAEKRFMEVKMDGFWGFVEGD
jgi:hypothetical protein